MVIGWRRRELADREARPREDARRFRKTKPFWRIMRQAPAISQHERIIYDLSNGLYPASVEL
jgi:hypothetical protein